MSFTLYGGIKHTSNGLSVTAKTIFFKVILHIQFIVSYACPTSARAVMFDRANGRSAAARMRRRSICGSPEDVSMLQNKIAVG